MLYGLTTLSLVVSTLLGPSVGPAVSFRNFDIGLAVLAAGLMAVAVRSGGDRPIHKALLASVLGAALVWMGAAAATHLLAFQINGVDFSIFDWMLENAGRGRPGYSPIYAVNHLGVHSSFALLLLAPFHHLAGSPWFLVLLGPLVVWSGVFPALAIGRRLGVSGGLGTWALATAYLANAWSGRLVNAGFRLESLVPPLCLLFLLGWLTRRAWWWAMALVLLLMVKEDATLSLGAFFAAALARETGRRKHAAAGLLSCVGWLALYVWVLRPALLADARVPYAGYWAAWGETPAVAVVAMVHHPLRVLERLSTSGLWAFFAPLLFLPWYSRRAGAAMLPTVLLLGTASNALLHDWGAYYAAPLVPFALYGLLEVQAVARVRSRTLRFAAAAALLAFPLFHGGYARTVDWDPEKTGSARALRASVAGDQVVYAQTVLLPHLGYPRELQPLFDLRAAPKEAALVVNLGLDPWPFSKVELEAAVVGWRETRALEEFPGGFLLFRLPEPR